MIIRWGTGRLMNLQGLRTWTISSAWNCIGTGDSDVYTEITTGDSDSWVEVDTVDSDSWTEITTG